MKNITQLVLFSLLALSVVLRTSQFDIQNLLGEGCASDEYRCTLNGDCISGNRRCDGHPHCPGGQDETGCVCTGTTPLQCLDNTCISRTMRCNGRFDCGNGDDELHCGCATGMFHCDNGHCIKADQRCDLDNDCDDGSDEQGCPCASYEYRCTLNGPCISGNRRCDGHPHCPGGQDETGCVCTGTTPLQCLDNTCISRTKRCNGRFDCGNGDDELHCGCASGMFQCDNGRCIKADQRCDLDNDCGDDSDEQGCSGPTTCASNEYRCTTYGHCISGNRRCDGHPHCPGGQDEMGCDVQIGFMKNKTMVSEGDMQVVLVVQVLAGQVLGVVVNMFFRTIPGSATADKDYTTTYVNLTFAGTQSHSINISLMEDRQIEDDEEFYGELSILTSDPRVQLKNPLVSITIMDTSNGAELTIEGVDDIREESLMTRSLCVRLAGFGDGLERDINLTLEFVSLDLDTEADFTIEDYNLTIPSASPINSMDCFIFRPVNDEFIEGNETFVFAPSATNKMDVFDASGPFSLVIFDNDMATVTFEVDALTLSESNSTMQTSVCLTVTGEFQGRIVKLSLVGGELFSDDIDIINADDLTSISAAGSYCFTLAAKDDEIVEEEETFTIGVHQDGVQQTTTLSIIVTDNDKAGAGSGIDITIPIVSAVAFALILLLLILAVIIICARRIKKSKKMAINENEIELDKYEASAMRVRRTYRVNIPQNLTINSCNLQLNDPAGQGEFGIVYKARLSKGFNQSFSEVVAVKTLKGFLQENSVRDLVKECVKMSTLDHPNILTLIGVCMDGGPAPYIVMPFMFNGSLLAHLKKERENLVIPPDQQEERDAIVTTAKLMNMSLQVAKGMEYLSSKRLIHRDLAARNCMIDMNFVIKVADFGLAESTGNYKDYFRQDESEQVKLPVKWLAPECFSDGIFSEKSDVWAFGVTCWEIFSGGKVPYPGISPMELPWFLENGRRMEMPRNAACTGAMSKMMMQCWTGAKDRPTFCAIVISFSENLELISDYTGVGEEKNDS